MGSQGDPRTRVTCTNCGYLYTEILSSPRFFTSAASAAAAAKGNSTIDAAAAATAAAATAGGGPAVLGNRNESLVDVPVKPKPRKFFDAKTFREFIKRFKEQENKQEEQTTKMKYVRPPPGAYSNLLRNHRQLCRISTFLGNSYKYLYLYICT